MPDDEARIARLEAQVAKNVAQINALAARLTEAHEATASAMRTAQESVHELESISEGLMRHIQAADRARAEEAAKMEGVRAQAAAAHAKRFDNLAKALSDQGATLVDVTKATNDLGKTVKAKGNYTTLLIVLSCFFIPAASGAVVSVITAWKTPVAVVQTPSGAR